MNLKGAVAHILILTIFSFSVSTTAGAGADPLEQQRLDKVVGLPGQNFAVNFSHFAGYVMVNKDSGRNLFYWLLEAVEEPESKPLILWLTGVTNRPGCSSIAYGEAEDVGPFHIESDGKTLYLNPHAWNQVANILFIDSPVGVGFSYSETPSDLLTNGDKRTAQDALIFLSKWLKRFQQYKERDFFIIGESYAGHFIPQLSQAIVRHNLEFKDSSINLKGYMVGNGLTDDFHYRLGTFQFLWSSGIISDATYKLLNVFCDFQSFIHPSDLCTNILNIASNEMGNIDPYSIFTPPCSGNISSLNQLRNRVLVGRVGDKYDPCTEKHSNAYFNLPEVESALHVHPEAVKTKWDTCSDKVTENWQDSPTTVLDVYRELIHSGIRIWVFSGDTDAVIPTTATRYSIDALKLKTVTPWQAWYDDGQVGGWTQGYDGLTFVTVRGAGHEVPLHKPKLALTLVKAFLAEKSLATPTQVGDM